MSCPNPCENESSMSEVWVIIVVIILAMIVFGYVSSKITEWKARRRRRATIPPVSESLETGRPYNIVLSDGRRFEEVEILGTIEHDDEEFSFAPWEGLVVLRTKNDKKIYVKKPSIRYIEEI